MDRLREKVEKIQEEIEELEERELNWQNLEKLSILYNVEHHMCKKLEMMDDGLYSESKVGFHNDGEYSGTRELREMTNHMSRQQLADVVVGYGRELSQNGNNGGFMRLYNRTARQGGSSGNSGGNQ